MKPFVLFALLAVACAAGCAVPSKVRRASDAPSIGSAEMKTDRSIVLRLRAETADGAVGEGYFVYPIGHPEYQKILQHVGPLAPGQSVSVRPWPDEKKPNKALEPTPGSVTPRADARVAPAPVVAHL